MTIILRIECIFARNVERRRGQSSRGCFDVKVNQYYYVSGINENYNVKDSFKEYFLRDKIRK